MNQSFPNKVFLCLTCLVFGCSDKIDDYVEDRYQYPTVPTYSISLNIEGKLLVKFFQESSPVPNSADRTIGNYVDVINLSGMNITNLKLLVQVYRQGSVKTRGNLLIDKVISLANVLAPDKKEKVFIDSFFNQILKLDNVHLEILELNDEVMPASGIYNGTFKTFKDSVATAGLASGFIDYRGRVTIELENNVTVIYLKGIIVSEDNLIIGNALKQTLEVESAVNASIPEDAEDNLKTNFVFADNDVYDSVVLQLKR